MVDLTPLLAAFCPHASSSRGEGLVNPHASSSRGEGLVNPHASSSRGEGLVSPHASSSRGEGLVSPHASSSRGEGLVSAPLDTPTLTDILEGVVSRQYWRTSVRVGSSGDDDDDSPFYKDWGDETRAAMWGALRVCGFLNVPNATGYYHWTDISTQETKVRVCGVCGGCLNSLPSL